MDIVNQYQISIYLQNENVIAKITISWDFDYASNKVGFIKNTRE